ncbi:hypothetical protein SNEBB_010373 [Seison nebaliae]|nr:hypothetical protein SNEBB_010373 [Seison nebaliae]
MTFINSEKYSTKTDTRIHQRSQMARQTTTSFSQKQCKSVRTISNKPKSVKSKRPGKSLIMKNFLMRSNKKNLMGNTKVLTPEGKNGKDISFTSLDKFKNKEICIPITGFSSTDLTDNETVPNFLTSEAPDVGVNDNAQNGLEKGESVLSINYINGKYDLAYNKNFSNRVMSDPQLHEINIAKEYNSAVKTPSAEIKITEVPKKENEDDNTRRTLTRKTYSVVREKSSPENASGPKSSPENASGLKSSPPKSSPQMSSPEKRTYSNGKQTSGRTTGQDGKSTKNQSNGTGLGSGKPPTAYPSQHPERQTHFSNSKKSTAHTGTLNKSVAFGNEASKNYLKGSGTNTLTAPQVEQMDDTALLRHIENIRNDPSMAYSARIDHITNVLSLAKIRASGSVRSGPANSKNENMKLKQIRHLIRPTKSVGSRKLPDGTLLQRNQSNKENSNVGSQNTKLLDVNSERKSEKEEAIPIGIKASFNTTAIHEVHLKEDGNQSQKEDADSENSLKDLISNVGPNTNPVWKRAGNQSGVLDAQQIGKPAKKKPIEMIKQYLFADMTKQDVIKFLKKNGLKIVYLILWQLLELFYDACSILFNLFSDIIVVRLYGNRVAQDCPGFIGPSENRFYRSLITAIRVFLASCILAYYLNMHYYFKWLLPIK